MPQNLKEDPINRSCSSCNACPARPLSSFQEERGVILPLTLIILLVLAGLVSVLLATGVMEPQIAANVLRGGQALSLAEAGAERTLAQLIANSTPVDCAMATPEDGCPIPTPSGATTLFASVALDSIGTYTVTYRPISFATLLIESTGRTNIGSVQRTVRLVVTKHYISSRMLKNSSFYVRPC